MRFVVDGFRRVEDVDKEPEDGVDEQEDYSVVDFIVALVGVDEQHLGVEGTEQRWIRVGGWELDVGLRAGRPGGC